LRLLSAAFWGSAGFLFFYKSSSTNNVPVDEKKYFVLSKDDAPT